MTTFKLLHSTFSNGGTAKWYYSSADGDTLVMEGWMPTNDDSEVTWQILDNDGKYERTIGFWVFRRGFSEYMIPTEVTYDQLMDNSVFVCDVEHDVDSSK